MLNRSNGCNSLFNTHTHTPFTNIQEENVRDIFVFESKRRATEECITPIHNLIGICQLSEVSYFTRTITFTIFHNYFFFVHVKCYSFTLAGWLPWLCKHLCIGVHSRKCHISHANLHTINGINDFSTHIWNHWQARESKRVSGNMCVCVCVSVIKNDSTHQERMEATLFTPSSRE